MSPLEMTHILRLSRYVHCNLSFDGVGILTSFVHCQQSCKLESELIPTFPPSKIHLCPDQVILKLALAAVMITFT